MTRQENGYGQRRDKVTRYDHLFAGSFRQPLFQERVTPDCHDDQPDPPRDGEHHHDPGHDDRAPQQYSQPSFADPARKKDMGRGRNDHDRNDNRSDQGEGFGIGQRREELALGRLHREYRQEADHGRQNRGDDGAAHLRRAAEDDLEPVFLGIGGVQVP